MEFIKNEPYTDGPNGSGQYTDKIYHIDRHLPSWLRSLAPKTAQEVHEESWNAYPYTKTRFSLPFVEKFQIYVETLFLADSGYQVWVWCGGSWLSGMGVVWWEWLSGKGVVWWEWLSGMGVVWWEWLSGMGVVWWEWLSGMSVVWWEWLSGKGVVGVVIRYGCGVVGGTGEEAVV